MDIHWKNETSTPILDKKPIIMALRAPPEGLMGAPIIQPTAMDIMSSFPRFGAGIVLLVSVYNARAMGTYIGAMEASLIKADGMAVPSKSPITIMRVLEPDIFITSIPMRLSSPYFTSVAPMANDPAINQTASWAYVKTMCDGAVIPKNNCTRPISSATAGMGIASVAKKIVHAASKAIII